MKAFILTTCLSAVLVWTASDTLQAAEQKQGNAKAATFSPTGTPNSTLLNINRIAAWYDADGIQETFSGPPRVDGFTFPRGTATLNYGAGLVWGGIFNDGSTPALRFNGQSYETGTKPGAILGIRTGLAEDPNSPDVRIWRIRDDYATADLTQDAAEFFRVPIGSVTQAQIDSVRNQYARDWSEWPWQKGAPFYDTNGNGVKDPVEDPGLLDADPRHVAAHPSRAQSRH